MKPEKILIIGDFHIPNRASEVNPIIVDYLTRQNYSLILSTGDLTSKEVLSFLESLGTFKVVKGNMDFLDLPDKIILEINNTRIGLIHGHQVYPRGDLNKLTKYSKALKINILISGHTHSSFAVKKDNIILLNPGSVTGAWGGGDYSGIEEFMEVEGLKTGEITVRIKRLISDKLKEEKYQFNIDT
ncbi:MAG: YfcE family phosphodiesterase [Candidatus Odinarchaeia archaeon]